MAERSKKIAALIFGSVGLLIILGFCILILLPPKELADKERVFAVLDILNVILAISCGAVASVLDGFLHIDFRAKKKQTENDKKGKLSNSTEYGLRAAGGFAVFVLVFFFADPGAKVKTMINDSIQYSRMYTDCTEGLQWVQEADNPLPRPAALANCNAFAQKFPDRPEPYALLGRYYWFEANYSEVISNAEKALAKYGLSEDYDVSLLDEDDRVPVAKLLDTIGRSYLGLFEDAEAAKDFSAIPYFQKAILLIEPLNDEAYIDDLKYWIFQTRVAEVVFTDRQHDFSTLVNESEALIAHRSRFGAGWHSYHLALAAFHTGDSGAAEKYAVQAINEIRQRPESEKWMKFVRALLLNEPLGRKRRGGDPLFSTDMASFAAGNDAIRSAFF